MSKRPFEPQRDGGALLLFVAGTLVSVLMVMVLTSDGPLTAYTGTAAIAEPFVKSFGAWATLAFAAGLAFLGARSFLSAVESQVLRHALGLVGILLGLASIAGAFHEQAGGAVGALLGGGLARAVHPMLGALAGGLIAAGSVWFVWLRPSQPQDAPEEVRQTLGAHAKVADTGVSSEEAAGLVPAEIEAALEAGRRAMAEKPTPIASPYPEDVRLRGEIPAGAKPLEPRASTPRAAPAAPVAPLAAAAAAAMPAPAPLVRKTLPAGVKPLFEEDTESANAGAREESQALPVQPSWETTGLSAEDEPVDAYGTPLSVIKSVRPEGEEPAVVEPLPPVTAAWESAPEDSLALEELEVYEAELDESEMEELDELEASLEVAEPEDATEIAEEELELLEEPQALIREPRAQAALEPEEQPEPEVEPVLEPQAPARAPLAQTTIFDLAETAPDAVELFPETAAEPLAELEAETEPEPEAEPEHVLQPQASTPERAHKAPAVDPERAKLLREVGCLFVERGRVAVSMLQRQYSMDFDDACKVLDELQNMGLIGPYLGGQRRDILLSREQWLEKVGAE